MYIKFNVLLLKVLFMHLKRENPFENRPMRIRSRVTITFF